MVISSVFVEMGHHALALESTSLWNGVLDYGAMEERGEWLERKGSQDTHMGSIMIRRERVS